MKVKVESENVGLKLNIQKTKIMALFSGTLHSDAYIFPFLLCLLFTSLLFTAICKASPDSHFAFFAFLFHGDGLDPCQDHYP